MAVVEYLLHVSIALSEPCSWPAIFTDTLWHDSDRGEVTFNDAAVHGWVVTGQGGSVVEDWECYTVNEASSNTVILTFKAMTPFTLFDTSYYAFACLRMAVFSENGYYYYQMAAEEPRLEYDRLIVFEESTLTTSPPTEATLCLGASEANAPTTHEYHIIIRNDNTETAIRSCPDDYLGVHKYTVTDQTSSSCGTGDSAWDVCTNPDTMVFNYTLCTTTIAYSDQGIVNCVFDMATGDYHLLTVMTRELSSTHRFTCFMSFLASNGTFYVSQYPGSCTKTQTPFDVASSPGNSVTGIKMVLVDTAVCFTTTSTTTSTTTTSTTTTTPTTTSTTTTTPTTTSTTTTPTTTTTTPTTTTTTPTTTTTTPTTTTPTPTTTTTTTTTTPTTTTTTPTTTTTATSTTTTTIPTTTSTATTLAPTTQAPSEDKTVLYIAIAAGIMTAILLVILIGILVNMFCCKKPPPSPPLTPSPPNTPDFIIEALPHKTAGYGGIPWGVSDAPKGTTIIEDRDVHVAYYPEAKHNGYTKSVQVNSLFTGIDNGRDCFQYSPVKPHNCMHDLSTSSVPIREYCSVPPALPVGADASYIASTRQHKEIVKKVKVFDGIIMDETVNFALRYSSRMQQVSKEWHENRHSDRSSLVSEKVVYVPTTCETPIAANGRVSITDISERSIYENEDMNSGRLSSSSIFHSAGVTDTTELFVSPVSDVTLPVSPVNSTVHYT